MVHSLLGVALIETKGDPAGRLFLRAMTEKFLANYRKPVPLA
jgi:hypothetical protein